MLIALVIGYAGFGPYIAIHQIESGVAAQDSEKLSDNIDFPSLRSNLKEQVDSAIMKQAAVEFRDNPIAALGVTFASKLVDGMVDSFVTPSGLANLISGKRPPASEGNQTQQPQPSDPVQKQEKKPFENARYTYDSPSKFSAWVKAENGAEIRFVLLREGLRWKLANIIIPLKM